MALRYRALHEGWPLLISLRLFPFQFSCTSWRFFRNDAEDASLSTHMCLRSQVIQCAACSLQINMLKRH